MIDDLQILKLKNNCIDTCFYIFMGRNEERKLTECLLNAILFPFVISLNSYNYQLSSRYCPLFTNVENDYSKVSEKMNSAITRIQLDELQNQIKR